MPASSIKHRCPKSWHKISIQVDPRMTEAVAAYLADLTGTGLEITSPHDDPTSTALTYATEKITAYIPISPQNSGGKAAAKKIEELRKFLAKVWHIFPDCPAPVFGTETIAEEDWGAKWKSFFTSFQITPRLTIKPSWEVAEELEREGGFKQAVIEMDPGLAFGTGHHASTQLALLLLEELFRDGAMQPGKVLDVGTGSGILAMACGLFGAREVLALDNDPDAVETAKQNILRNRLEGTVSANGLDVKTLTAGFDIVVANITHDVLAQLAKPLSNLIYAHGFLVLSGILKGDQENSIREIYAEQGLEFMKRLAKDEWAALQFKKK
jgi:ribosomal protein L11 methyltransferase